MKNQKKTGELKFRDYFGTTAMSVTDGLASTVMTGLFMLYLTDYAGIGQWGAILGSGLLMFARLFDAINDPFEGWLMDRGKITKYGKYRPETSCQGLFNQIHKKATKKVPEALSCS